MTHLIKSLNDAYERHYGERTVIRKDAAFDDVRALAPHFEIQEALRPLFGKGEPAPPSIGDHPDFGELAGTTKRELSAITTMFVDMEGSTRLGLLYDLETVYRTKNAVIQIAIDVIKAFDGHVHRIMGDAVMAFFGAKQQPVEQGALDALNCAAALRGMLGNLIESRYPKLGADALGIRIGIDYGPRERVLWASYGYPGMHEVTATSYHVDVAAKLQQCAPRNQIMVGQSLRDLLDIPEELLRVKQVTRDGEDAPEPYVLPNYAGKDGRPVDYRKHIFRWAEYLRCTRIAEVAPEIVSRSEPPFRVSIGYADVRDPTAATMPYFPGGSMLPKDKELKFSIELPLQPRVPIAIDLDVENHGKEASAAENSGNHSTRVEKTRIGDLSLIHWEGTRYRGLHYLDVVANSHGKRHCASRLGIWIA